ncbi:MAG: hypothetical protein MI802_20030 [Desulfobacterales bacterium]|nr:hypothetical protein [Desulfobacterales bacterium]
MIHTLALSATTPYRLPVQWNAAHLVESVTAALRRQADEDNLEQAVYSIDTRDELELHPLIQDALRDAGYGVHPEQRYPADRTRRRKSEGKRCDIVLTPDDRALMEPDVETTLFAPPDAVVLEAAFWLEIKTVSQFTTEGPFARYAAEMLSPVSQDIKKMASDPLIYHAGLMLILFTADQRTAEHDLAAWESRTLKRGYPVAPPITRGFDTTDRLGNARCTVALFPVRRL